MKRIIPFLAATVAVAGCRTNKDILNDYERNLVSGNYADSSIEVSEKSKETGEDQLLWYLLAGGAKHLAGDCQPAIEDFDSAENIFIANDQQSVFSKGASGAYAMMTNDRVFPFAGGGQDRIFTCFYKAIDYGAANNIAAMRTELNRADEHQKMWIDERKKDIEAARERMEKDSAAYAKENKAKVEDSSSTVNKAMTDPNFAGQIKDKTGFNPMVDGNLDMLQQKDYLNLYVQHASGVFRWLTDGTGREYFRGLPDINATNQMLVADLRESETGVKPKDQVWIYVEDGLCPCREEWRLDLPTIFLPGVNRYLMYTGMALPYLRYRDAACAGYSAVGAGGERPLELLQDIDRVLKVEHDVYMRGALAREITRAVVKTGVQIALGAVADNCSDYYTKVALKASQAATAAWAASVTKADLRSWTSLPKAVYACRVTRPADGKIVLKGNGAEIVSLTVPAGNTMIFVNKPAASATPSVRCVTF